MKDGDIILLNGFDLNYLSPPTLRSEMAVKIYNAKSALNGDRLYQKFMKYRRDLRIDFASRLPNNLGQIPSGNQLRDT